MQRAPPHYHAACFKWTWLRRCCSFAKPFLFVENTFTPVVAHKLTLFRELQIDTTNNGDLDIKRGNYGKTRHRRAVRSSFRCDD